MKYLLIAFWLLLPRLVDAQELFTYTEPASNMAAKSIGLRLNTILGKDVDLQSRFGVNPEIMFGISRKIMIHSNLYFSNYLTIKPSDNFTYNGAGLSAKFRFYSEDQVHSHFRLAAFAKIAYSNMEIEQPAINLNGNNTGYEVGLVATKLISKVAISASGGYLRVISNNGSKSQFDNAGNDAFEYTLSLGKLMLPKEYTDYNQTNINLMAELLGQYNPGLKAGYLDLAPSVQIILQSRMRIDAGYRFPLSDKLFRSTPRGFLLRFEYNIFNAYK